MKVGIFGCGNAGLALYYMMRKEPDFDPVLYSSPKHRRTLALLTSNSGDDGFICSDGENSFRMEKNCIRPEYSMESIATTCDVIVNTLPINAHIEIFDEMREVLTRKRRKIQFVNLSGGFAIFDHFQKQRNTEVAFIASSHTLPFASRVNAGGISILNRRRNTPTSISDPGLLPTIQALEKLMGTPMPVDENHLHCAIDRSSYVMHPLITMLNFTKIERSEEFYFYRHGLTKSVERLLVETGHERRILCEKLGFFDFVSPETRVANFLSTYMGDFSNVRPPSSAEHRFFTEDIPFGLVFMCTLGRIMGVSMPLSESIVHLSSSMCCRDFWASPLNLSKNSDLAKVVLSFKAAASS